MTPAIPLSRSAATSGSARPLVTEAVRTAATVLLWASFGGLVGLLLAVTAPALAGYQVLTVLSGSMTPTFRTGDLVIDARISPLDAKLGDVVTFKDPDGGHLITHRVRRIRVAGTTVQFVTKGDQNNNVERWTVPVGGTIGRVVYRVPKLGYVTSSAGSRLGRLLLVVFPALLLGGLELWRIWRPTAKEQT